MPGLSAMRQDNPSARDYLPAPVKMLPYRTMPCMCAAMPKTRRSPGRLEQPSR